VCPAGQPCADDGNAEFATRHLVVRSVRRVPRALTP
jgi:hypothetical protein